MFFTNIRFLLVALFFILGIILHVQLGFGSAWYLYLASLLLLATHFLFGTVWQAFAKLRKGNLNEAELLINRVKRPDFLWKPVRSYYYFVKGMIALQRKQNDAGKTNLQTALEMGLRNPNDNALTALNIAHININININCNLTYTYDTFCLRFLGH